MSNYEITDYQAKYFANEILKRNGSNNNERFARTLLDLQAKVDINPHQVDAALFAFSSPLSSGAILADEVGLGKTIEAGLVISQKWAEEKRKILIIVPATLRKQWVSELKDKFFLASTILESKNFNQQVKSGADNPFRKHEIIICSYPFAAAKSEYIARVDWDLVVIDEAHRMRNVYKSGNVTAKSIKDALEGRPKVLLTATPLQNSLQELYGLVSIIDERVFGDVKSFRQQFVHHANSKANLDDLKDRLKPIIKRTLRKQVTEYVPFTNRHAMVEEFIPTAEEQELYDEVSEYLRRELLYALPKSQRHLMTLIIRKLLASSTFAVARTLDSLIRRLEAVLKEDEVKAQQALSDLTDDFEDSDNLIEEWEEESQDTLSDEDKVALSKEIEDLKHFHEKALGITNNSKGLALQTALGRAFSRIGEIGANKKAIIFTESTRTQKYLFDLLSNNGYKDKLVLFNGSNNDDKSKEIYSKWLDKFSNSSEISGSKSADMRSALVDYFEKSAEIMIATEAAAEGINLQFCSLVVNYDLPWNPQRIEQRIGRSHRYGQKFDVVVLNFLNKNNHADQRVYQLLEEKFKLFNGVFGSSDEVLGAIENGVDFERKVLSIYQDCRTAEEIEARFIQLQEEMKDSIDENMSKTRKQLLENFDAEVHEKLKISLKESKDYVSRYEKWLWLVTLAILKDASFDSENYAFKLKSPISAEIPAGNYRIGKKVGDHEYAYRSQHPLARKVLDEASKAVTPPAEITFNYSDDDRKVHLLDNLIGRSGYLKAVKLSLESFESRDFVVLAGSDLDGNQIDDQVFRRMLDLPATITGNGKTVVDDAYQKARSRILENESENDLNFFRQEQEKITRWTQDKLYRLERELTETKKLKRDKEREVLRAETPEKLKEMQEEIANLTKELRKKRSDIFDLEDEIEQDRDKLIASIENQLRQKVSEVTLFEVQWKVI